ncbi:MAG TPA: DUF5672 family protein [Kiritimatiellia bacterium]|nr:DUF5672 family protein [Kiritimatiellia bacterium]
MSPSPPVIIAVPVYRPTPDADEELSLRHLKHHLGDHPMAWVMPEGLDLTSYERLLPGAHRVSFHPDHFRSRAAYSRLLRSAEFYRAFEGCEFLLIHQLDCLVFSDQLQRWAGMPYDYIGAPWIARTGNDARWIAGNGGFSLRRIDALLRVLTSRRFTRTLPRRAIDHLAHIDRKHHLLPNAWLRRCIPLPDETNVPPCRWHGAELNEVRRTLFWSVQGGLRGYLEHSTLHEDLFWSLVAPLFDPALRVAPPDTAVRFAFEMEPRWCFAQTGGELPFGCHAWQKYDRAFWEPFLLK